MRRTAAVPIVIVLFIWTLTTHGKFSVSGDEPHYLLISESLLVDRDLDLDNNYRNGDGERFGAGGLTAGLHVERNRAGAVWSVHDVGLSVLILPVYAAATRLATLVPDDLLRKFRQDQGLLAYSLVGLSLVLLTGWGIWLVISGLRRVAPDYAAVVALVLGLSPPVVSHAFLIFPDIVAFVVSCAVVWLICLRPEELTTRRVTIVIAAIGLLPWLHRKYVPLIVGLGVLIFLKHGPWVMRQRPATKWSLVAWMVIPQAALHVWTLVNWGTLGGPQMLGGPPFTPDRFHIGALGLLVDRERGLLSYAPVYGLLPACWALGWRANWPLLIPAVLLFVPMAMFINWPGGFSPASRYLLPIMPLLVVPVATALRRPIIRWASLPLLIFQAAITAVIWNSPRALWPKEQATNAALEKIPLVGPAYERWLPSLATGDPVTGAWGCVATIGFLTVAIVVAAKKLRT